MLRSYMQKKVKELYPTKTWADRVKNMKSAQLYAIYRKNYWADGSRKPTTKKRGQIPGQMSMSDFMEM